MRALAGRWLRRGMRPPMPTSRQALPVALAGIAVIAAASTSVSAARVTTPDGAVPGPVAVGQFQAPLGPPQFPPSAGPATTPAAPGVAGRAVGVPGPTGSAATDLAADGIPVVALRAYRAAERRMAREDPGCGVRWSLLAAIGRVESNHGQFAGATLLRDGRSDPPIIGVALDGRPGVALITDTDHGRYDGDTAYDRAVGPMQFIPGTWALFAVDGNADGRADPFDINDVALAAARYLCRAGGDLRTEAGMRDAVYSYNRSEEYVRLVLDLAAEYAKGARVDTLPAPDRNPRPLPPPRKPTLPPGTVGRPPAASPAPATASPTPGPTTTAPTTAPGPAPTTSPPTTTAPTTTPPSTTPPSTTPPTTSAPPSCTPAPTPTPTPTPTGTPSETPTPTPTATPTVTPTPTPTVTPTPSPTPPCPTP